MLSDKTLYFIENLKTALIEFPFQTKLTSLIVDRMLSGVQVQSQDQVTGLMT